MLDRICFVFSAFPPLPMGGVQRYLINVATGLHRFNIHSTILTRYYPPLPRVEQLKHYTIRRIGFNPFPFTNLSIINKLAAKLGNLLTYSILGRPEAIRVAMTSSIVHSQFAIISDVNLGQRIADSTKRKHVVTVHTKFGRDVEDFPLSREVLTLLSKADYVIVNRNSTLRILTSHGIDRISLIDNPILVSEYRKPRKKNDTNSVLHPTRILFVGRLVERRGPFILINAFSEALKTNPEMELWIVGTGNLETALKTFVKKQGLDRRVRFFGNQLNIAPIYWNSDIFVAPSPIANSPSLALREAMASGLAIIATDVEETKRIIIPNNTGIVSPTSPTCLADAIVKLARDQNLRLKLGKAAANFAEDNLDINKYVIKLINIYKETLT